MEYKELLKKVQDYAVDFLEKNKDQNFHYHNADHTHKVVQSSIKISNHYELGDEDFFIVTAAAWFHDLGYLIERKKHETRSTQIAEDFLKDEKVPKSVIAKIKNCILSTEMPQHPENLLEKILCDADLYHLGTDTFQKCNQLMFEEANAFSNQSIEQKEWEAQTIELLKNHRYHTDYCRLLLNDTKIKNLKELLEISKDNSTPVSKKPKKKKKSKKRKIKARPDKGIETMFRVTATNNQRLSQMADDKAHIMITVNSIILSAILGLLLRNLDAYSFLAIPTYLLLTVSVLTIIFSVLATRPKIPAGVFTRKDLDNKSANLLFFGNFYKMDLKDYSSGMWEVMSDREFLYGSLIKDVYSQGITLGKKYKFLRISYDIFMYGIILSVFAFIIASFFSN